MEKCHAALDINYDLKIFRCFSLSDCTDVSLRDFGSFSEIRDFFAENIDSRLQRPAVFSQCATCTLVSRCNGGCLSNNGTFMDAPTKRELMTEIFAMISRNEIDDALVRLETIMPQTIAEKMLRAKLLLHVNRIEDAKRLLYFCANNASSTKIQNEALNIIISL
jgi:radical SAM protein with 4Fe4S-binding SPASM domain